MRQIVDEMSVVRLQFRDLAHRSVHDRDWTVGLYRSAKLHDNGKRQKATIMRAKMRDYKLHDSCLPTEQRMDRWTDKASVSRVRDSTRKGVRKFLRFLFYCSLGYATW